MSECPHVFFVGNQPKFDTAVVSQSLPSTTQQSSRTTEDEEQAEETTAEVRLITIPRFKETGQIVLLDLDTLVPEMVQFDLYNSS